MPSSDSPAAQLTRDRLSRHHRIEQIVEHLASLSVDDAGAPDVTAAVDVLVDIKIDRAIYMRSHGAEQNRGPNIPQDHRFIELEERCEAARINLRRILARHGAGR